MQVGKNKSTFLHAPAHTFLMPQLMYGLFGQDVRSLRMPDSEQELMPNILWGKFDQLFTPAFWYGQAWLDADFKGFSTYRIGVTLREEVAACLLGGHGIPAEVGLAAFHAIRSAGLLSIFKTTAKDFHDILAQPIQVAGRPIRYRFARQKSEYLSSSLNRLNEDAPPTHCALAFRNYFLNCRGIGPKTASWITRNWLDSHEIAIIDIHIHRAGLLCGLFSNAQRIDRDYFSMEQRFIQFTKALGLQAATLDALIWRHMKIAGNSVRAAISKSTP